MPIPSNPTPLAGVIGEAADVLPIPAQDYTDPTQNGALNYKTGWPAITALPLEAGGKAPRREYFNALMQLMSSHIFFQQSGSLYPWSATLDYLTGAHVLGSDGKEYIAQKSNGPDVPDSSAVDPVGDESGTWLPAGSVYAPLATTETPGIAQVGAGLQISGGVLSTESSTTTATQDITFYVRQDGNDANSGTEDSPQGAWQTLQGALEKIMAWDFRQYQLTLSVGNAQWDASGLFLPNMGKYSLIPILKGNGSGTVFNLNGGDEGFFSITPSSSWVIEDMAFALSGETRINNNGGFVSFNNTTFSGTTSSPVIYWANCAKGTISNCSFDCSASSCILPNAGGQIIMTGNISVSGNYSYIINAINGGFAVADGSGAVFTGSPTGTRYNASLNGVIDTRGGGPNFIPGTSAGTVSGGGVYV